MLSSSMPGILSRKRLATSSNAYLGQLEKHMLVQQLTREGNFRQRTRRVSPTGLMHRMMWRLSRTPSTKHVHRDSGESGRFYFSAVGLTPE
jgi:hypothetical protein